jgi:hypothetical protein
MITKLKLMVLLILCSTALSAQSNLLKTHCANTKPAILKITSKEEMTVTGVFTFNLEVLAYDTCKHNHSTTGKLNRFVFTNTKINGFLKL